MVQKYTFQICQKLAIAAALAAALCCLPVVAQTNQTDEILILNDKPVTFSEFLNTYPDDDARDKALSPLPRETKRAFYKWQMARLNKREAEKDVALKLITEVNAILDELAKEQAAPKSATPEQQAINKNRAATIMAALNNADITNRMKLQTQSILRVISNNLQKGGSIMQMNSDLIKNAKTLP